MWIKGDADRAFAVALTLALKHRSRISAPYLIVYHCVRDSSSMPLPFEECVMIPPIRAYHVGPCKNRKVTPKRGGCEIQTWLSRWDKLVGGRESGSRPLLAEKLSIFPTLAIRSVGNLDLPGKLVLRVILWLIRLPYVQHSMDR
jgi:hypothetical protein